MWNEEEREFFSQVVEILRDGHLSKYRLRVIKQELEKKYKKEKFQRSLYRTQEAYS